MKVLTSAVIDEKRSKVRTYGDLDENFRRSHAQNAAAVLSKIQEGTIHGVRYDFVRLQRNLGLCFSNKEQFELSSDVFTTFMGNATSDKLTKVFTIAGMSAPFGDQTGRNAAVKKWASGAGAREASKLAKQELDDLIHRRNEIAHGSTQLAVQPNDVASAASLYSALAEAFVENARQAIA